jgi:hypothetical protein
VIKLEPQELAELWYLKYGHQWQTKSLLDDDWKNIARVLMKNNLADYTLHNRPDKEGVTEIIKLKEPRA